VPDDTQQQQDRQCVHKATLRNINVTIFAK